MTLHPTLHRTLLPSLLPAILLLVCGAGGPRAATAEDDLLRVPTRHVSQAEYQASAAHPSGDLVAAWGASGVVLLTPDPPPRTGWVPSEPRFLYGRVEIGRQSFLVALGMKGETTAVLGVDLDGDLGLRGPGEIVEREGRPGRAEGRGVVRWRAPNLQRGSLEMELTFQQVARSFDAVLLRGGAEPLPLADAPPTGVRPPAGALHVRYATVPSPEGPVAVAFVRGEGDRLAILTDANRNGILGEGDEVTVVPVQARDPGVTIWQALSVRLGRSLAGFAYREVDPLAQVAWSARSLGARRGTIQRGDRTWVLHLLDGDFDGTYGSEGDWWWFGPSFALERFTSLVCDSMLEVSQPFHVDAAWRLVSVDDDGNALVMKDPAAPDPDAYLHERTERVNETRYFPHFAEDPRFAQEHGIDPNRPQCAPPRWYHDVGLKAALRRAKEQGKPLLVDFEADWCNICKRWDYHVYRDREVAGWLARFVLLKVNVDFNFSNDVVRFGGARPPYLVFLDGDGRPLLKFPEVDANLKPTGRQVDGLMYFQGPAEFARTLEAAWASWQTRPGR